MSEMKNLYAELDLCYHVVAELSSRWKTVDYFRDYRSGKITKFLIVRAKEFKNGRYTGNVINRQITDLYGKTRTESMWGEEISERKEEQLKEDAKSDGRLDDFIFAKKDRGYLQDRVVMKGAYGGTLKRGVKLSQQSTSDVNWRK